MKTTNQFTKPITTVINSKNNLEIGGCDLVDLAKNYGTPLYVIDEKSLRTICQEYKNAFREYPKTNFMYASKALCTSALSKIISDEGFGFDVVSGGEIYTLKNAGINMKNVLFNGSNKTFEELEMAVQYDIGRISVDNFYELELLNDLTIKYSKNVNILLRITPGIECHTHEYIQTGHSDSKFGFDLTQIDDAVNFIKNNCKKLILKGLHAHIGSQIFETQVYYDEVKILINELTNIKNKYGISVDEINIGGGLGVKYTEDDNPPSIFEISNTIISSIKDCCKELNTDYPMIYLEPGRSIISTAGVTLYTVGSQKQVPNGRKYIAVDGGMADNPRPSMYQAKYHVEVANNVNRTNSEVVTVAGRYCESGDILVKDVDLPMLEKNDILCFFNTGAYNYSMSSNYNRTAKPAMVLVNSGKTDIIIKRETFDDIIRNDVIPNRLR